MAAVVHGEESGIPCSEEPIGGGFNTENITRCIDYLKQTKWEGVLSLECFSADENTRQSVEFRRNSVLTY